MMVTMSGGSKTGKALANYITGKVDHKGEVRADVQVLRGDPALIGDLADALTTKHKYTHCVIAWAPEDQPSPDQIQSTLDSFADLAWAGLEEDRRAYAAVLHREVNGGCHIHIIAARVDLGTGKAFNVAPPSWRGAFGNWRDMLNVEHGWARPDDPARARLLQGWNHGKQRQEMAEMITSHLTEQVVAGAIKNRDDVLTALKTIPGVAVTRSTSKTSISIQVEGLKIRLKGPLYEQHFNPRQLTQKPLSAGRTVEKRRCSCIDSSLEKSRAVDQHELRKLAEKHAEYCRKRAEYACKRYSIASPEVDQRLDLGPVPGRGLGRGLPTARPGTAENRPLDLPKLEQRPRPADRGLVSSSRVSHDRVRENIERRLANIKRSIGAVIQAIRDTVPALSIAQKRLRESLASFGGPGRAAELTGRLNRAIDDLASRVDQQHQRKIAQNKPTEAQEGPSRENRGYQSPRPF